MKAYLIDEGILLSEKDEEFDNYAVAYDKRYGYYDENQYYEKDVTDAIKQAIDYVNKGIDKTYAIVSSTNLPDDFDFEDCGEEVNEDYMLDDVVFSIAKINGNIEVNFLHKDEGEKILVDIIEDAKRYVKGELELDLVDDVWVAMDYREELGGAFPIEAKGWWNDKIISVSEAEKQGIDVRRCCDECGVAYVG